jgi:hypothetical protein
MVGKVSSPGFSEKNNHDKKFKLLFQKIKYKLPIVDGFTLAIVSSQQEHGKVASNRVNGSRYS